MDHMVPMVVEQSARGERAFLIFIPGSCATGSFLWAGRSMTHWQPWLSHVFVPGKEDPDKDIDLYINSPGCYYSRLCHL